MRKTAKNEENPRKSRVFFLASFLSRRIGGATLHSRFARKYPRPAPGVQAPRPSGGVTEPVSLRVAQENAIRRACSATKSKWAPQSGCSFGFGGATRIRTGDKGFADPCLTTWPWRRISYFNIIARGKAFVNPFFAFFSQFFENCTLFCAERGNGNQVAWLPLIIFCFDRDVKLEQLASF